MSLMSLAIRLSVTPFERSIIQTNRMALRISTESIVDQSNHGWANGLLGSFFLGIDVFLGYLQRGINGFLGGLTGRFFGI